MGKKFVGLDGLKHFWTKAKSWITAQITSEVTAKIAELVANAPEDLNTLKEIADWISAHADDASAMNTAINTNKTNITNHINNKSNPHGVTKAQVGLKNVGNFKAVSTVASQRLTDTEKSNARTNIGAGTSSFSGSYNDLTNKPSSFTPSSHTHTKSQITDFPKTIKFSDYKTESLTFSSLTDQKKIELANFGKDVTEDNVLCFMVIYWSGIHIIAQADWAKSQGTGSSGLSCALHSLNNGTGYCVIRCVYLV